MTAIPIGLKNTNLSEDIAILLPVNCRWIPFSSFKEEVENQRPGRSSCFSDRPKKSNYDEDVTSWFLSSFIVFRSAVSEEKSKMPQQIRGQADHLVFLILPRNTHWIEDVEILLTVKFRWILLSSFGREMDRVMAKTRILAMCRQWPWPWRYDLWPRPWHTLGSWIIIV